MRQSHHTVRIVQVAHRAETMTAQILSYSDLVAQVLVREVEAVVKP